MAEVFCQHGLGFTAGNGKGDADPDPWWLGESKGLVFEDHANGSASTIFGANKAKQAAMHPDWLIENIPEAADLELTVVLVTPCSKAGKGAKPALKKVLFWKLEDFQSWAKSSINTIRELKVTLPPGGDLFWRMSAADKLVSEGLTIDAIVQSLPRASDAMEIAEK